MSFDLAVRLAELGLSFALMQQSLEHWRAGGPERISHVLRMGLCILLALGVGTPWVTFALVLVSLWILNLFQGPYNGGSDRLGLLPLCCLCLAHNLPVQQWREYALGYLAVQVVLSYFIAGWVKIINPEWRSGRALQDVFLFSAYPVSEGFRRLALRPRLLLAMSWAVMAFELMFPVTMLTRETLFVALGVAAVFHLANACLFGLNRFFWTWVSTYPAVLWLQQRIM